MRLALLVLVPVVAMIAAYELAIAFVGLVERILTALPAF